MRRRRTLLVHLNPGPGDSDPAFDATIGIEELSRIARRPSELITAISKRQKVTGRLTDLRAMPKPLLVGTVLRLISSGPIRLEDRKGRQVELGWAEIVRNLGDYVSDRTTFGRLVRRITRDLDELETMPPAGQDIPAGCVTYLKPDLWLGSKVGGAVAHSAGIVNAMQQAGRSPIFSAFERNPIISDDIPQLLLEPPVSFWNISEAPLMAANHVIAENWPEIVSNRPSALYARVSAFHYSSSLLARRAGLPVVLEYNGSEPWIARNWGVPFKNEILAMRIEDAVLQSATRIVVVSEPLREELLARGIGADRIVVQPNAVDPKRFRPDIEGSEVKARFEIDDADCVFGFIGSFGRWHGIDVMIEAFAKFSAASAFDTRLLVIGDGTSRKEAQALAERLGAAERIMFTGVVPQANAPDYLAACDVLLAPHVGNSDGSIFFGSPTKLFEYMAMGRAILASRLGQIAEVLDDEKTALLVPPGNVDALAAAMERIAGSNALRDRLGAAARRAAVERHGWRTAVERIFGSD